MKPLSAPRDYKKPETTRIETVLADALGDIAVLQPGLHMEGGTSTLNAGTFVTVSSSLVQKIDGCAIILTRLTAGSVTSGDLFVDYTTVSDGVSFDVWSTDVTDDGQFKWNVIV